MKHVHVLGFAAVFFMSACSTEPSDKAQPLAPSSVSSQSASANVENKATTPDYIKADDINAAVNASAQTAANTPAPNATAQAASMSQVAADTINNSQLTAQQKVNMNEKVQALMASNGNSAQMAAAGNALVSLVTGGAAVKLPGFGLLDPAAAVAAVMDLINAIVNADPAGIQAALMDLIAALA